jgi:hypothetical protein
MEGERYPPASSSAMITQSQSARGKVTLGIVLSFPDSLFHPPDSAAVTLSVIQIVVTARASRVTVTVPVTLSHHHVIILPCTADSAGHYQMTGLKVRCPFGNALGDVKVDILGHSEELMHDGADLVDVEREGYCDRVHGFTLP